MAISDHAQAHDALFPLNDSTLPQTDPELADLFSNWALGDVVAHGGIDTRTRVLIQLASLIAIQAQGAYRLMVGTALDSGVSPVEVKEVLYQAIPYAGMGKVYDFLHITNEVFASRGIALPVEGQSTTGPDTRWQAGFNLQIEVFGPRMPVTEVAASTHHGQVDARPPALHFHRQNVDILVAHALHRLLMQHS